MSRVFSLRRQQYLSFKSVACNLECHHNILSLQVKEAFMSLVLFFNATPVLLWGAVLV